MGYLTAAIKTIQDTRVGDTITLANHPAAESLPGYRKLNPMVYAGLYPVDSSDYNDLRESLEKLQLNDASLEFEAETSQALGFGFRTGFLGLLHMDVIQERLEREFDLDLIVTAPSVIYKVMQTDGTEIIVDNPSEMPDPTLIEAIYEPYVEATIMVPNDFVGAVMELCERKRGDFKTLDYLDEYRVNVVYSMPMAEIIFDFFDRLKSNTKGYASLDYHITGYQTSKLVKLDILLNGEIIDAFSTIVHKDFAYNRGKVLADKLKEIIPVKCLRCRFKRPLAIRLLLGQQSKHIARTSPPNYMGRRLTA